MQTPPSDPDPPNRKRGRRHPATASDPQAGGDQAARPAAAELNLPDLNLAELAQDWITLWHSELNALASDRETAETWQALVAVWAGVAGALVRAMPADAAPRPAGAAQPAGAAPPAAAHDVRDAEIERLRRSVAELERRLADIEQRSRKPGPDRRGAGRIPRRR